MTIRTWFKGLFNPRVRGLPRFRAAFALDYEVVVKFAYDPQNDQIAFARNHDIAISLLKRGWSKRPEIVTGTVEVRGDKISRTFNLLDYSLFSTLTPIDQALKDKLTGMIGELAP